LLTDSTSPASEFGTHGETAVVVIESGEPEWVGGIEYDALRPEDIAPLAGGGVDTEFIPRRLSGGDETLSLSQVPGGAVIPSVANGVLLHIDPNSTDFHAVSVESGTDISDLSGVGLAAVSRSGAGVPVGIDFGIAGGASVVVRSDEVGIDLAADAAGFLETADDSFGEAFALGLGECSLGHELGRVNAVNEGETRGEDGGEEGEIGQHDCSADES